MASGLVALIDDVAGLTRLAAASLDDVAGATARVGVKAAGIVVDDTAVTPRYVVGLSPKRELPIIGRIGLGSLRNKLLFLLPGAVALSALAPWAVTPLLMAGGLYLCFEGAEKVLEAVLPHHAAGPDPAPADMKALEDKKVAGAIRTDLILSAEVMAISLAEVSAEPLLTQAVVLALVGLAITLAVYGAVALIVKVDDIGLYLAKRGSPVRRAVGRDLVLAMPAVLKILSVVGTAAMLWVGGGILLHGIEHYGVLALPHALDAVAAGAAGAVPAAGAAVDWIVVAAGSGLLGLAVGGAVVALVMGINRVRAAA